MEPNTSNEGTVCVVKASGPFEGIMLIEVARNCGYAAHFRPRSLTKVEVRASESQLNGMAAKLRAATRLFDLRRWEAIAEAVQAVGGKPTESLLFALDRARKRVESLADAAKARSEKVDPSVN